MLSMVIGGPGETGVICRTKPEPAGIPRARAGSRARRARSSAGRSAISRDRQRGGRGRRAPRRGVMLREDHPHSARQRCANPRAVASRIWQHALRAGWLRAGPDARVTHRHAHASTPGRQLGREPTRQLSGRRLYRKAARAIRALV
jgi:hypothetical protein